MYFWAAVLYKWKTLLPQLLWFSFDLSGCLAFVRVPQAFYIFKMTWGSFILQPLTCFSSKAFVTLAA
jgi:hypothetical protein